MKAAAKKQRDMTVQILDKLNVDQSMSRGNDCYTQRLTTYELIVFVE